MSRGGRPPLEDVRKHFEKVTKVDGRGRKTPRQKCNYCENDIVDLIDRLKKHLMKCSSFPEDLKGSLSFIMSKNQTSISDSTNPEEQPLDKMDADKKLARFFYSTGIPFTVVENPYWLEFIKAIQPAYISPNRRNLANNLLDAEYQVERQDLNTILEQASNITLASDGRRINDAIQPVDTRRRTCLDAIQSILKNKLGLQMSVVQPEISSRIPQDLRELILGNPLWENLDALSSFLTPFVRLIHLFESDTSLLSGVYNEWQNLSNSVNMQKLDLDFKMKVYDLINQWFKYASHPAMAIANLLDPNFCGKSLEPDDFEKIILPYLGKVYTFENAAHIYGVMQKYIAKTDEFSGALLWASAKYSSPIGWWKSNFTYKFPIVVELACRVLSIPTSSATAMHD
ncbi:8224_t:CDS:2 [Rhizophagus irregularis]|nr:8224_t:CDS:2 [Rhizophagus irregularis]